MAPPLDHQLAGHDVHPRARSSARPPARRRRPVRARRIVALAAALVLAAVAFWTFGRSTPITATAGDGGPLGIDDGYLATGDTVGLDDDLPAITQLDGKLLDAVRQAAADAADDGIELRVTSGWRSAAYQEFLIEQATATHGSGDAHRTVLPPDRSRHVTGDAIDIGPTDAAYWLAQHGSDHGLCQVYANEIWHYELLTSPGGDCPEMLADASS